MTHDPDIHAKDDHALISGCIYGHLKVVKWLMQFDHDMPRIGECLFIASCDNGNLEVAKWLMRNILIFMQLPIIILDFVVNMVT